MEAGIRQARTRMDLPPIRPDGPASGWGRTGLLAVAAGLLFLWPARGPWGAAPGSPLGEVDNHLWMFWMARLRLLGDERVLANAPDGFDLPLMDPINLPLWLLGAPLGPGWALLLLQLAHVGLAMAGGWLLSRQFAGPAGARVGMVALGTAPFLGGVLDFGLTESWGVGLLALHAAFLVRHAREGRARDAVAAGLFLGACALSGWYLATFALAVELVLVPWLLWQSRRPGLVLQGGLALAMALPPFLRFLEVRDRWAGRWHPPPERPLAFRPSWAELPYYGTDALNFVLPRLDSDAPSKAVYLGLVGLALAAFGLWRRPRLVGPLLGVAALPLALALGHWPSVGGHALGLRGPAWWLADRLPAFEALSHWHRAVGGALPFLAAAAAVGAEELGRRARRAALLLPLLVVADGLVGAPTAWPRAAVPLEVPVALLALPGEGGVVQLPFDNARAEFGDEPARLFNRWQVLHGHPVSESYESVDALLVRSPLVALADRRCGNPPTLPPEQRPPPGVARGAGLDGEDRDPARVAAELDRLRAWGYRSLVLHRGRARTPDDAERLLRRWLGPPVAVGEERVWDLEAAREIYRP
jgi:hypothetical protein